MATLIKDAPKAKHDNSALRPCTCTSEFQDREHGHKYRVHNFDKEGKEGRCTVCGHGRPPRGPAQGRKLPVWKDRK